MRTLLVHPLVPGVGADMETPYTDALLAKQLKQVTMRRRTMLPRRGMLGVLYVGGLGGER